LEVILYFLIGVKAEFVVDNSIQQKLFPWTFEILNSPFIHGEAMILCRRTVLTFFGSIIVLLSDTIASYSQSLESLGLSFRALETSLREIHVPQISTSASRAIDKILRTSALVTSHLSDIAQAIRHILRVSVEIADKIRVVEGYTALVAQSVDEEQIPQNISVILEAFGSVDTGSCDCDEALEVLKVISAIGKKLYVTSPGKLQVKAWTEGNGREMAEWVRDLVSNFSRRFAEVFEVMEVCLEVYPT
jgi:hypothetical protein